jgi:lysophospholipase L1-like esterase
LAIKSEIGIVKDPIIIFGDSIVQGASLPRKICGQSIVNAGIVGAGVGYFGRHSREMLSSTRPSLIVLAVGVNDATRQGNSNRIETFRSTYESTVKVLLSYAPVALTTISPIKNGSATGPYDSSLVPGLNEIIRATHNVKTLIDVTHPLAEANLTTDGIHLNAQGYAIWTKAIVEGISRALECGP